MTARIIDPAIVDVTVDQQLHRLRVHSVAVNRYSRQAEDMEWLQVEIEAESKSIQLARIPRWLLSLSVMENILTDP